MKAAQIERNRKLKPILNELSGCLNERDSHVAIVIERKLKNIIPALFSLKGQVGHLTAQETELTSLMKSIITLKTKENEN